MKKFITIFAIIGIFTIASCSSEKSDEADAKEVEAIELAVENAIQGETEEAVEKDSLAKEEVVLENEVPVD